MPNYDFLCDNGHEFERYLRFSELDRDQVCECGRLATRQIRAPMIFVSPNVCYDSPIDGRPITSKQARLEDLKRSGCVEYDPGMRQDYVRRIERGEKALDRALDATVDKVVAEMPPRKLEKLAAEIQGGLSPEAVRTTRSE